MTEQEIAAKVVELVGGKENISAVRHCVTRLQREFLHRKLKNFCRKKFLTLLI